MPRARLGHRYLFQIAATVLIAAHAPCALASADAAPGDTGGTPAIPGPQTQPDEPRLVAELTGELQALGGDLMGDSVSPDLGTLSLYQTDVSLRGSSALDVSFGRRYAIDGIDYTGNVLGGWNPDVPFLTARVLRTPGWQSTRCSVTPRPFGAARAQDTEVFWSGVKLFVPGAGGRLMIGASSAGSLFAAPAPKYTTEDHWRIDCLPSVQNGAGEGFLATSPSGIQYRFDYMVTSDAGGVTILKRSSVPGGGRTVAYELEVRDTDHVVLYATRAQDASGNWVNYHYESGHLTQIESNDGRRIDVAYDAFQRIQTVRVGSRTWTYSYTPGNNTRSSLDRVTLPDGTYWEFGLPFQPQFRAALPCELRERNPNPDPATAYTEFTVRHPNGTLATYRTTIIANGRSNVPRTHAEYYTPNDGIACNDWEVPPFSLSTAVTRRTLSLPGGESYVWSYGYEQDLGLFDPPTDPALHWKRRTITDPNGDVTTLFINRQHASPFETLTMREERFDHRRNETIEARSYEYANAPSLGSSPLFFTKQIPRTSERPIKNVVIERGSDRYTTEYSYDFDFASPTYSFDRPTHIRASSSLGGGARETSLEYVHRKAVWVVALPLRVTRNGKVFEEYEYDALGRQKHSHRIGQPDLSYDYADEPAGLGVLASTTDALGRRTGYSDYKRGQPRTTDHPDQTTTFQEIDDYGQVTRATNGRGYSTSYEYDELGRVKHIVPPQDGGVAPETVIRYPVVDGLRRKVITRGPKTTTIHYDGLYRPTLVEEAASGLPTVYQRTAYDGLGRATFTSLPSFAAETTTGKDSVYDALGRLVSLTENVAPRARTSMRYLSGNQLEATDPLGKVTTATRSGYGSPDDGDVVRIVQPMGVTTELSRDILGYLTAVRQFDATDAEGGDQTQGYFYDDRYRLCRHSVPESGDTLFAYDDANQQIGVALGQLRGAGCADLPESARIRRTYDGLGRVKTIDYPDSTGDITYGYDENGDLRSSVRAGGGAWSYAYNDNDQLERESLAIDGRTYVASYGFDANGYLATETTPGGRTVQLLPDGSGRPTQALANRAGAEQIHYHPNGRISSMVYENGYVTTIGLNPRQLLSSISSVRGSVAAVNWSFDPDASGRIRTIHDAAVPGQDRSFDYDDLGRLRSAGGPWGAASYSYDALGNLHTKTLGARTVEIEYDDLNRVDQVRDSARGAAWTLYDHDARGNVASNGQLTFRYDLADQPVTVAGAAAGTYAYDGNFKRVRQTVNGRTTYSVYGKDGALLFRDDATDGESTDYVEAGGLAVMRLDAKGEATYLHSDHLGSPMAATNPAGQLLWRESYGPFGEKLLDPEPNRDSTGFTGHIDDAATGLTYMQARYYDPAIGRFLSTDASEFDPANPVTFNRYAYVGNDPVNACDPTGNDATQQIFVGTLLALGAGTFVLATGGVGGVVLGGLSASQIGGAIAGAALGTAIFAGGVGAYNVLAEDNASPPPAQGPAEDTSDSKETANAARREVMRRQGIPTSQQPVSQSKNESGRSYEYKVPKAGGGTEQKSVQQQTKDRSHSAPHYEAGSVKTDDEGNVRTNRYGRPRLETDKSKTYYGSGYE